MSMEGIEQNPIVYDLMSEMAFHHRQVDLQVKLKKSFSRRASCTIDVFFLFILSTYCASLIYVSMEVSLCTIALANECKQFLG
jgi:hypothetical protein